MIETTKKLENEVKTLKDHNNQLLYKLTECRQKVISVMQQSENENNKFFDYIKDILKITYCDH